MTARMAARALFLDRDGTLVHPRHYPARPRDLVLYSGIAPGLRRLRRAGFRLVVITNQAGIARGYFGAAELAAMHAHLAATLAEQGVRLDAIYHCPHHPDGAIPELAIRCECRKPAPGLLLRAARELGIDLARSWMVGDILDDVAAGNRAGCRTVLVDLGTEEMPSAALRTPAYVARDTVHALRIIAAAEGLGTETELTYLPPSWQSGRVTPTGRGVEPLGVRQGGRP
jgi:D-glycero-D-manno-heptose 1,7-bisphosphate phosphatase